MDIFSSISPYILIIIICFPVSLIVKGLIDKFVKEEEMLEVYENEHEDELSKKLTKEEKRYHKEAIKELKSHFEIKFSLWIFILLSALVCVLFKFHGLSVIFIAYAFLTIILVISFSTDLKICIIPDETNIAGAVIGVLFVIYNLITNTKIGIDLAMGGIIAILVFAGIGGITYLILKKEGMGGGDIKLVLVIGLFMGLTNFLQIFVVSFFVAAIISIILLITKIKSRTDYIPFGPFLCIGTYITMLIPAMTTATYFYKISMGMI